MTVTDDLLRQQASAEATRWLILLQEEADDQEVRAGFEAWLATATINREAWAQTEKTMRLVERLPADNTAYWRENTGKPVVVPLRLGRRQYARVAWVGAAAACFLLFLTAPDLLLRMQADIVTGTAETRVLHLEDGSEVTLAPGSALSMEHKNHNRTVTLLAGEALFSVVHNPEHPFTVKAGDFTTTDIGTIFDVHRVADGVGVAVRSGRVRVSGGSIPIQGRELGAGQGLVASASGVREHDMPAEQVGAWGEGLLVANDEPLGEVVNKLRPYLRGMVVVPSSLASQRISGVYSLTAPERALEAVAQARQGSVYCYSPWLTVLR